MFELNGPAHLSNHSGESTNDTATWLLSLGDGRFVTLLRSDLVGTVYLHSLACSLDAEFTLTQGTEQSFEKSPPGSFSNNFSSAVSQDDSRIVSCISIDTLFVLSYSGLSATQYQHILTSASNFISGGGHAKIVYVPPVDKYVIAVEDVSDDKRLLSVTAGPSSVTENSLSSQLFIPDNWEFAYPTRAVAASVGSSGDIVYAMRLEQSVSPFEIKMVFVRVSIDGSGTMTISSQYQITDTDGQPIGIAADPENNRFAVLYINSGIKAVYGELGTGTSLTFGTPVQVKTGTVYSNCAAAWQKGLDSFTAAINYRNESSDDIVDVLPFTVDGSDITPETTEAETLEVNPGYSFSGTFDASLNQTIIGMFGDGSVTMPQTNKPYVIAAEGEPAPLDLFWDEHTLQNEKTGGYLYKKKQSLITPGSPGQPYIAPIPALPSYSTVEVKTEIICVKVV